MNAIRAAVRLHGWRGCTRAALLVAAVSSAAAGCDEGPLAPQDRLEPVEIRAAPDLAAYRVGDSIQFKVDVPSGAAPAWIRWRIVHGGESATVEADRLDVRLSNRGPWAVQVRVGFEDGSEGEAAVSLTAGPNSAPLARILAVGERFYSRVPLGDTILLAAEYSDPDDAAPATEGVQWLEARGGDTLLLHVGDTLRWAAEQPGRRDILLRVRDPHGAYSLQRFPAEVYDPGVAVLWRRWVAPGRFHGWLTELTGGALAVSGGAGLFVLDRNDGETVWTSQPTDAPPLPSGPSGALYVLRDGIVSLSPSGDVLWRVSEAREGIGPVVLADGTLAVVWRSAPGSTVQWLDPGGATLRTVEMSGFDARGMVGGRDGSLYLWRGSAAFRVVALTPSGSERWSRDFAGSVGAVVPAGEDRVLVTSEEALFAVDARTGDVLWVSDGVVHGQPAVAGGRIYVARAGGVQAVDALTGSVLWSAEGGAPLAVAADGRVFSGHGRVVLGLDGATGTVTWRLEMAEEVRELLVSTSGLLVAADRVWHVEAVPIGSRPAPGPWPMSWGGPHRCASEGGAP